MGTEGRTRLLALGTGSIRMGKGRSTAGYLLATGDSLTLLDGGPGTLYRISESPFDALDIDRVVLSHLHIDHHADLMGLLFLRKVQGFHAELHPLQVVGPKGIGRILEGWREVHGIWVEDPGLVTLEIEAGLQELGDWKLRAFPARHSPEALCLRFEDSSGRVFAYSGDTDFCEGLVEACREADFALLECSFPDEEAWEGHLCPSKIRRLCAEARPRRVGLTHFYPPMQEKLEDPEGFAALWKDLPCEVRALADLMEVAL